MILTLLVAAAVAAWAWRSGYYRRPRWADLAAIVAGLLAIRLMTRGEWLPALIGFGWTAGWFWYGGRLRLPKRAGPGAARPAAMSTDEARGLLGVPATADAATIRAAHRRLIARVHPDTGGSADLARRVNAARDALLAELNGSGPRAS